LTFDLISRIFVDKAARFFNFGRAPYADRGSIYLKPLMDYFAASRIELAKVTWPNRRQTARLTLLVIAFSIVMAIVLGALDSFFTFLIQKIIVKG
jgi:preprotein translocase SecE subunit